MAKKTFIPASKAAELAGVTTETIRNLCKAGTLQHQIRGILYYVSKADVMTYKHDIEAIHEATASITEYRAKLEQDAKELRTKHADYKERMMTLEMFPKRIVATLELLKAVVYNYRDINEAHDCFDPRYADVVLAVLNGKPYSEIAERMKLKEPSIAAIWRKALRKFEYTMNRIDMLEQEVARLNKEVENRESIILELNSKLEGQETTEQAEYKRMRNLLATDMWEFDLSMRVLNTLRNAEINTLGDLVKLHRPDLLHFRNFGKKSLNELDELMENNGLSWNMDTTIYE